jgi:hypothetical protein
MMRDPKLSASRAARDNSVTIRDLWKYIPRAFKKDSGGRIHAIADQYVRRMEIPGPEGPIVVKIKGYKAKSEVARFRNDVFRFLGGDRSALEKWKGIKIQGHELLTDPRIIRLLGEQDSLAMVASKEGGTLNIPGAQGKRILTWDEVDRITAKFQALNPYDPDEVPELLNLTDDNNVCKCSHELKNEHDEAESCEVRGCNCRAKKKVRRQLWGVGIAAKRYTLFEKVFDQKGNVIDIKIVNPKAHGIGFLFPPKDNPKNWKRDAPLWVYEMWDYIVRGFIGLERNLPGWASLPQMMRFSVSTWNVLKMLGMWDGVRPHNFMFMVMTSPKLSFDVDFENKPDNKPMVIVPFSSRQEEWSKLDGIDIHNKNRRGRHRRYRLDDPGFHPLTYGHMIQEYIRHPEVKSLGPDGTPCTAETRGLLQRAHITAGRIRYIDKETSSMWAQGDDLSVVTDNDEAGFRVVEYGKSRKVVLPDSLKREIQGTKLQRELRRRGIGQHTIEKALHAHVRVNTYRKIVSAIDECRREKPKSRDAMPDGASRTPRMPA